MLRRLLVRFIISLLIFLVVYLCLKFNFQLSITKETFVKLITFNTFDFHSHSSCRTSNISLNFQMKSKTMPIIARILYLFLCEDQTEIDIYLKALPSITADVLFFCWADNCHNRNVIQFETFYVAPWLGSISKNQPFVRFSPQVNYIKVQSRVMIINELQLNLTNKTTWTTARNLLLERALLEEHHQGWRWAYFNFGDGDIQIECPLTRKLLKTNKTDGDEIVFAKHFRSLATYSNNIDQCFLLIDTFLLSVSPAIGVIDGIFIPSIYNDLLTQIVYHIDAIFNAFHRDALPFLLPYCSRYDQRSWWTSQAILIYRSLCLYGHAIQFNAVRIIRQKHGQYPHDGNPWDIDGDMNLVPTSLISLQTYMQQSRIISPLVLRYYNGWSLELTSDECRQRHTSMNLCTCQVNGELK